MRLTKYTDYSLRVLIYLASAKRLCTIKEISESYGIPKNHLVKVVHQLASDEWIESTRGKGGGIRLDRSPEEINLGEVVRSTEQSFEIVECFAESGNECVLSTQCKLSKILGEALAAFLEVLDQHTLADITTVKVKKLLRLE